METVSKSSVLTDVDDAETGLVIPGDPVGMSSCSSDVRGRVSQHVPSHTGIRMSGSSSLPTFSSRCTPFLICGKIRRSCGNFAAFAYHDCFGRGIRAGLRDSSDLGIPGFR
jgi:hypothetical protein